MDRGALGQGQSHRVVPGQAASDGLAELAGSSEAALLSPTVLPRKVQTLTLVPASLRLATITLNGTLDRALLIPDLRPGEIHGAVGEITVPAGKGLNVARTAHALGAELLTTGLVAGSCGRWICALLRQLGIPERFVHLGQGESRMSTILVEPGNSRTTIIHDAGPSVADGAWPKIHQQICHTVRGYPWVALCGSCPSGVPRSAYGGLCRELQDRGQRVCLDARDQWLANALPARPYLVKCNHHEATRVLGCPVHTLKQAGHAARHWIDLGIENVVITLGAQGAVAATGQDTWYVAAPHIEALSPVGSGDAMMAGLIIALDGGNPLPTATRYGVALGAANALVLGAGCCDLDAVPALLRDTRVTPMGGGLVP